MTEYFAGSKDDEDARQTKWRSISRKMIAELNEKINKRRQALFQCPLSDELSQLTSDEESTSASSSKFLCDEYHRKKILDAELKFKVLEGFDTLSESSSLSSSFCFHEIDVHEETDERTSATENVNSHNSGGDEHSDGSESPSYSTSFSESIEEDIDTNSISNEDTTSSYMNVASSSPILHMNVDSSPISHTAAEIDNISGLQPVDGPDSPEKNMQKSPEVLSYSGLPYCFEQPKEEEDAAADRHWPRIGEDDFIKCNEAISGFERDEVHIRNIGEIGNTATTKGDHTLSPSKNKGTKRQQYCGPSGQHASPPQDVTFPRESDDAQHDDDVVCRHFDAEAENRTHIASNVMGEISQSLDQHRIRGETSETCHFDIKVSCGKEGEMTEQLKKEACQEPKCSSIDRVDNGIPSKMAKPLHGFDDIHELFIEQVCEVTMQQSMLDAVMAQETPGDDIETVWPECNDDYMPTLNHLTQKDALIPCEECDSHIIESSPPKGIIPFQNMSCNRGSSSNECVTPGKPIITSAVSTRRQAFLKGTLNRPLQYCIEKARLVTSIRETIEKARTIRDRLAGRAAYKKAVKEFTDAVDTLLVEQIDQEKDDNSLNDDTYSLDDAKLLRKQAPNPLDVLRTPISKRRIATQQEILRKTKNTAFFDNESKMVHYPTNKSVKNLDVPSLQRTSTFLVHPTKKIKTGRDCKTALPKNNNYGFTANPMKSDEEAFPVHYAIQNEDEQDTKTYSVHNSEATGRGELTMSLAGPNDNDDTAYVSDLSPPADNDTTTYYVKERLSGNVDADVNVLGDHVFDVSNENGTTSGFRNDDETFRMNEQIQTVALDARDRAFNDGTKTHDVEDYHCTSSDDETLNILDSFGYVDIESVNLDDIMPCEVGINSRSTSHSSIDKDEQFFETLMNVDESKYELKDYQDTTMLETNSECFIQFTQGTDYKRKDLPLKCYQTSNVDHDHTSVSLTLATVDDGSGRRSVDKEQTMKNSSEKQNAETRKSVSSRSDASPCQQLEQTDDIKSLRHRTAQMDEVIPVVFSKSADDDISEDVNRDATKDICEKQPMKNTQERKLKNKMNELTQLMKHEITKNESLFSICSSTSGEYSLLNPATQKRSETTPLSTACPENDELNSYHDKTDSDGRRSHGQNDSQTAVNHPPSEMIIREKSADNIEEICVESLQISQQWDDIPSACVVKHDGNAAKEKEKKSESSICESSDDSFETSINYLRKTAIGCLGPLREKVAFFENIERALQSNETQSQCSMDAESLFLLTEEDDMYRVDRRHREMNASPRRNVIPDKSMKDCSVQAGATLSPEQHEPQTVDASGGSETRQGHTTCSVPQDALSGLIHLVDDLRGKVSNTNELFGKIQNSFDQAVRASSLERERITGSLDSLSRRIDSNETVILEKISRVENCVLLATQDADSGLEMVKEAIDKLRSDNAGHFESLKQFSSDIFLQKEDLCSLESKVASDFKEHITIVQTALDKLEESKPSSSSSPSDNPDKRDAQPCIEDARIRLIEMRNQRDAEKMYHKITRESMRALERDHDRLRQEILLSATRKHFGERRKSSKIHSLTDDMLDSKMADIEIPPLTSTPRKISMDTLVKGLQKSKTKEDGGNKNEKPTPLGLSDHDKRKEKKLKK